MSREFNVLISSAGRRVALVELFRQSLQELSLKGRVLGADMSRCSPAFHSVDEAFQVPACASTEFVPRMLSLCREHRIGLIVPTIDTELATLSAARDQFAAEGVLVAVSDPATIAIAGDKQRTHAWLVEQGLPTVAQQTDAEALAAPEGLSFPLLVKPVAGSAGKGIARVGSVDELRSATRHGEFVVQSIARGVEFTVDGFVDPDGRCVTTVPRRRIEVRAGEVSKAESVRSEHLMELASRVFEALPGAYGALNVQIFVDSIAKSFEIIEINPRFGGGYPLSWRAGDRSPRWLIEQAMGLPPTHTDEWEDGVVMLRYDAAVFVSRAEAGL